MLPRRLDSTRGARPSLRFIFDRYRVNLLMALDDPGHVIRHFGKVSALPPPKVRPPEATVDQIAPFEVTRNTTNAITPFRTNTELYTASPNAFDELRDALRSVQPRSPG